MKVMTYNILCGGQSKVNGEDRLGHILDVIKGEEPDVLALQEANGFTSNSIVETFSSTLGLPFHALSEGALFQDLEHYHVVVFSRYSISLINCFPECELESAAIAVLVESPIGNLSICNVHLHATSETRRIGELKCILKHQKVHENQLIVGDLNSISQFDAYSNEVTEFELRYDVTDLLNKEFVDVGRTNSVEPKWTHPSRVVADHSRKVSRRIDYVFASPSLSKLVTKVNVIQSDLAHRASDHFPLVVEFR